MDHLRRSLAPIAEQAWEQIDETARQVLKGNLSARKIVDVSGPKGMDYAAVSVGRMEVPAGQPPNEVTYGIRKVLPIVETRVPVDLDLWELDNAVRGAEDLELGVLETAAKKIAQFEEQAVYQGFKNGGITGLVEEVAGQAMGFSGEPRDFLRASAQAVSKLARGGVNGPYGMVINPKLWAELMADNRGAPFKQLLGQVISSDIVFSDAIDGALVVSRRGGDAELIIGSDFAIGYMSHDNRHVRLFLTESFTFRVLDPGFAVVLKKG